MAGDDWSKERLQRWIGFGGLGVVGLLVIAGVISSMLRDDDTSSAASSSSISSATRTVQSFKAAPTTSARNALADWKVEVGPSITALGEAFNTVGDAALAGDYATTRSSCRQLDAASSDVASHLPAPDVGLDATMEELTGNASAAARLCMDFDENTSPSVIRKATDLITKANGQIETATKIVNGLG